MAKEPKKTKSADTTAKKVRGKPFVKGQPSPNPAGRPAGSRNKISSEFIEAMASDFAKHGPAVIADVRENSPRDYLKLVADLVPREFDIKHDAGDAFLELWSQMGGGAAKKV